MRILYNGMYFYPEVGGMEVHMLNLARGFTKLGHEVEVITSNSLKSDKIEFYDEILIIRTPFFGKSLLGWVLTTIFSLVVFLRRSKKASIIHGHDIASILPGVLAKIIKKKPFILTLHSSHFIKVSNKFLFKQFLKWGIKKADYVFAASVEIKNIAKALVSDKRVEALTNPVDTELFSPEKKPTIEKKEDEYLLVCPRRLVEKNGVHFLIEAMPEIVSKRKIKLVVAGDGPLRGSMERRLKELDIRDKVVLLGSVPNEEMPGVLISADLIVIPSLMEATSIAALESMSCGKAIAASRVGGLPEIIDEKVGFLMEPGNLARKKVVENWSAKQLVNEHFQIYKNIVEHK